MTDVRVQNQIPRYRSRLITRERLERQLDEALARSRMVLLVAPAGYGKTAALAGRLRALPEDCAAAWVTVDSEADLEGLWVGLAEALEPFDPPWRLAPEALRRLIAQPSRLEDVVEHLVATLGAIEVRHGVLALDDLHAVTDRAVFDFLGLLVERLPPRWTLAIATRVEPLLMLDALRVRRELAEFRQDALSFSEPEVLEMLRTIAGRDDPATARRLHQHTQGWAAGLCLSIDAMGDPATSASLTTRRGRKHTFAYLATEVFDQMPDRLRDFLMRCSVLDELSAALCAALAGVDVADAAELLNEVERRGLFVSVLDEEVLTLRLHDLFRDFLEERLRQQHPGDVPALLRLAALSERDPMRKLQLLCRMEAWPEAQQQLAAMASRMLLHEDPAHVTRWIERFPAEVQASSPDLAYARGLGAWHQLLDSELHGAMTLAANGFTGLGRVQEAQRARVHAALGLLFCGRLDEARAIMAAVADGPLDAETGVVLELCRFWEAGFSGPDAGTAVHMHKVVDRLSNGAPPDLWYRCAPHCYTFLNRVGMDGALARFVQGALHAADAADPSDTADLTTLRSAAMLIDGWLALWRGRVDQAAAAVERLQHNQKWLGDPATLHVPLIHLKAACHAVRGEHERLGDALEGLWSKAPRASWQMLQAHYGMIIFSLRIMTDDWNAARGALLDVERLNQLGAGPAQARILDFWRGIRHFEEGRLAESLPLFRDVVQTSQAIDHIFFDAALRIQLAAAELRSGRAAAAWEALAPLVERLGPHAAVIDVLTRGEKLLVELANASWGDAAPPAGIAALQNWAGFVRRLRTVDAQAPALDAPGDSPLSARELDVLKRIAAGDSNKLIARALDLSPHTVKRHVARILERLEVASRGEAAAWYRRSGAG